MNNKKLLSLNGKCRIMVFAIAVIVCCQGFLPAQSDVEYLSDIFDVAPFGHVVTSDPNRNVGACLSNFASIALNRTEEFKAEDVFLETDIAPGEDGTYTIPAETDGQGCIGLNWILRRQLKELSVEFADKDNMPVPNGAHVQYWHGISLWQGEWKRLEAEIKVEGNRWILPFSIDDPVLKIRWIIPDTKKPIVIRGLSAITRSNTRKGEFKVEIDKGYPGRKAEIEIQNGYIVNGTSILRKTDWDLADPLLLTLRYSQHPKKVIGDRTILSFKMPAYSKGSLSKHTFGVSIDDVLNNKYVYLPDFGVFVTQTGSEVNLNDVKTSIKKRETVLERVRQIPDQSFTQAIEKTHNPIQDDGPMMLSLACGNDKFVVSRQGTIKRAENILYSSCYSPDLAYSFEVIPQFGEGKDQQITRSLYGDWLPVPVTTVKEKGILYRQRSFVVPYGEENLHAHPWLQRQPLFVAEITIKNTLPEKADASVKLMFKDHAYSRIPLERLKPLKLQQVAGGTVAKHWGQLLAFTDTTGVTSLQIEVQDNNVLVLTGTLRPNATQQCFVYIPGWNMGLNEYESLKGGTKLLSEVEDYWNNVMASALQLDLPDPVLTNIIRASQVHCLLAARNERFGKRFAPWAAPDRYGVLEGESNTIIRGMDLMGHKDFAERSSDYFINKYNPAGYLTTSFTLVGTGWHLWRLGNHYELTQDKKWLRKVAPDVMKVCKWVVRQLDKTKSLDSNGQKVPEYGLAPPGVVGDWNLYAYRFYIEGNYYAGLRAAGAALKDINYPGANKLLKEAEQLKREIIRSYQWAQARSPALALPSGAWVQAYPASVYTLGLTNEFYPKADRNRCWIYDIEIGAHHLAVQGVLDPRSVEVTSMMNHMEDVAFLKSGYHDYQTEKNQAEWFNLGGFGKVQPYYGRIPQVYALQDNVKPFIRSYFNTIASLVSLENLSLWEHFSNTSSWNKTAETGNFLQQSRTMLINEYGDELWLAPFVTNNWLKDKMTISVANAPTRFGRVGYTINSDVRNGFIQASIDPPQRSRPKAIVIRLRHPDGKLIKKVFVNGRPFKNFDAEKEIIRLKPFTKKLTLRAEY